MSIASADNSKKPTIELLPGGFILGRLAVMDMLDKGGSTRYQPIETAKLFKLKYVEEEGDDLLGPD